MFLCFFYSSGHDHSNKFMSLCVYDFLCERFFMFLCVYVDVYAFMTKTASTQLHGSLFEKKVFHEQSRY